MELHGGTIRAENAGPGRGALFTIQLATVLPFPSSQVLDGTNSQNGRTKAQPLRLLVIEDHEPTIAVLARLLRRQGHDVLTAGTVKDALLLASTNSFDLVVSDLGLPDGSGIDLMRQLAQQYGLRGIALSGYGMAGDRVRTEQAGFLAHLVKPINFEQLQHVLQQVVPGVESKAASVVSASLQLAESIESGA